MLTRLPAAALCLLALTGCSSVTETADRAADCVALARDVAAAGISGTPSVEDAEAAVRRLDDRVAQLGEGEVRDAAVELRDRLSELAEAARAGDAGEVQRAGDAARQAARDAAAACSIPVDQFLG